MMKLSGILALKAVLAGLMVAMVAGCDNGDDGASPAAGLNVNGFWEGAVASSGSVAAGTLTQSGGSVTGYVKIGQNGNLTGTLDGYHMQFTIAFDGGGTDAGEGDFTTDGMTFNGNMPSEGDFLLSWRGPDFDHHTPYGETLQYTK